MHELLSEDVWRCSGEIKKVGVQRSSDELQFVKDSQFWSRSLLRAFFAQIEGEINLMASLLLALHSLGHASLSFAEQAVLREKNYRLSKGKIEEVDTFPSMLDRFRHNYRLFSRIAGSEIDVNLADHRWDCFCKALKSRHAITHPRDEAAFRLSPQALSDLSEAIAWYADQMSGLFGHLLRNVAKGDA